MAKNKVYSTVLSLVIAFGLWLYVVNNVSEETDITFHNIPVSRSGEAVLSEDNMMITYISVNSVSVNLVGSRDDLNKIDASNTTALVDLTKIQEPGKNIPLNYTLSFPADVPPSALEVRDKSPSTIFVDVDYRRTYDVPVEVKWTGTRSEDYIYDTENYTLDNPTIRISGPAAVADTIHHAEVEINLTERSESISESFRYTLCDAEGNPVDARLITTNVEEVRLDAQINRIQEVELAVDVIYGGGATKENTTVTLSTETIRVSGGEAVLKELGKTLTIGTINLADVEKTTSDQKFSVTLPEGVTNQTGVSEVMVTVKFTGLRTREYTVDNFQIINVPEGLEVEIITAGLTIKVRGPEDQIGKLQDKDITAVVDFSNAEVGTATYKAAIAFGEKFPDVGALKTNSVSAIVTAGG